MQIFHGLGKYREGIFDCLRQLFDLSSHLPEQGIVVFDLPIQFAPVRDNTFFSMALATTPSWTVGRSRWAVSIFSKWKTAFR